MKRRWNVPFLLMISLILAGCSGAETPEQPNPMAGMPPPEVEVTKVLPRPVELYSEATAEFRALDSTEIRARVEGHLLSRHFQEGSRVEQGQLLFQLDPRPYEASVAAARARVGQARGSLARAEGAIAQAQAQLERARTRVDLEQVTAQLARAQASYDAAQREAERYRPLFQEGAVASQRYDQARDQAAIAKAELDALQAQLQNTRVADRADVRVAEANLRAAEAERTAASAAVDTALSELQATELNLSYTSVRAPFTGIIGPANLDPGGLVVPGQTLLATLSHSDPIYADFQLSELDYLELGQDWLRESTYSLQLANSQEYPHPGAFVLIDREIQQESGTVMVRTRFPNPENLLKPGGFGRLTLRKAQYNEALVVPDQALTTMMSRTAVYVIDDQNVAQLVPIETEGRVAEGVVVSSGLTGGERVVVRGLQRVQPGIEVTPVGAQ